VIARIWRGVVRTEQRDEYAAYVEETGVEHYRRTPGNRAAYLLTRDLGDGRTEIVTFSLWNSMDDVRGFAGDDVDAAVYYPEDDRYLLERGTTVSHFEVHEPG
jgi:heme-degrading monooxygenase HmoA